MSEKAPRKTPDSRAPRTVTAADYARAEKFLAAAVNPLVLGSTVNATWLPDGGHLAILGGEAVREVAARGHEIGSHGAVHVPLQRYCSPIEKMHFLLATMTNNHLEM